MRQRHPIIVKSSKQWKSLLLQSTLRKQIQSIENDMTIDNGEKSRRKQNLLLLHSLSIGSASTLANTISQSSTSSTSTMSPHAPSFYPAGETVESVIGKFPNYLSPVCPSLHWKSTNKMILIYFDWRRQDKKQSCSFYFADGICGKQNKKPGYQSVTNLITAGNALEEDLNLGELTISALEREIGKDNDNDTNSVCSSIGFPATSTSCKCFCCLRDEITNERTSISHEMQNGPSIANLILGFLFSAYYGPASVPVTIPSSGMQRNSISSLSQSPSSPLGSLPHSTFVPHHLQTQNKQDQQIEQVRNVSKGGGVYGRASVPRTHLLLPAFHPPPWVSRCVMGALAQSCTICDPGGRWSDSTKTYSLCFALPQKRICVLLIFKSVPPAESKLGREHKKCKKYCYTTRHQNSSVLKCFDIIGCKLARSRNIDTVLVLVGSCRLLEPTESGQVFSSRPRGSGQLHVAR